MIAIVYDDNLNDKEMAKQSYRKFLEKYPKDEDPNDNMSASARAILQMLEQNIPIDSVIKNSQSTTKDTSSVKTKDKNLNKQDKTKDKKDTDKKDNPVKNNN